MPFDILESAQDKPFKVRGIAMRKNVLSKNGKFYSGELVEKVVNEIKQVIESSGSYPINMMADHPGVTTNKVLSVIGKITDIFLEGDNAIIEATIANTSVGKDVQELIKGGFVEGLSIRASNGKFKNRYIGDKLVKDVLEMELKGVDLVANPGVDGARITDIIESDNSESGNIFVSILEESEIEEAEEMDWSKVTIADIKVNRSDLYESIKEELKPVLEAELKVSELTESVNNLTESEKELKGQLEEAEQAKSQLQESLDKVSGELEEAEKKLQAIEESERQAQLEKEKAERQAHVEAKIGSINFAESVKNAIRGKIEVLESIEEIDKVFEAEVDFINMVIQESTGVPAGKGHVDNKETKGKVQEEQDFINQVLGM